MGIRLRGTREIKKYVDMGDSSRTVGSCERSDEYHMEGEKEAGFIVGCSNFTTRMLEQRRVGA